MKGLVLMQIILTEKELKTAITDYLKNKMLLKKTKKIKSILLRRKTCKNESAGSVVIHIED